MVELWPMWQLNILSLVCQRMMMDVPLLHIPLSGWGKNNVSVANTLDFLWSGVGSHTHTHTHTHTNIIAKV
jgi:hypothetical protein